MDHKIRQDADDPTIVAAAGRLKEREIEDPETLAALIAGGGPLDGAVFKLQDLTPYAGALRDRSFRKCIFLGCALPAEILARAEESEALIFPRISGLPYETYRVSCYSVEEIYRGFEPGVPGSYRETPDARIYKYYEKTCKERQASFLDALAMRLHDHAITDALNELLEGQKVVAFMGGHRLSRIDPSYRAVAIMARALRRKGFLIATGGGPGAMEAGNLGAYLARHEDGALDAALTILAPAPSFGHGDPEEIERWLTAAFEVRARFAPPGPRDSGQQSVGIPTWLYGHEPPNVFATHLAKYFANSVREEGVLSIANCGVIFAPGSAGTIQEIFQDATQNHYETFDGPSPMVFFGKGYWTLEKPVYPLLAQLAKGLPYSRWIAISDDPEEVVRWIGSYAEEVFL